MKFPTVNRGNGVETSKMVSHVINHAVKRFRNPLLEAIVEEMNPEIDELLKRHMGDSQIDLTDMHRGLTRAGRVLKRMQGRPTV